jgi:hypothetical protein
LWFLFQRRKSRRKAIPQDPTNYTQANSQTKPGQQDGIQGNVINGGKDAGKHDTKRQAYRCSYKASWVRKVAST